MRIGIVITHGKSIGGAQIHARDLARFLAAEHEVCVFMGYGPPLQALLAAEGIDVKVIPHLVHPISPVDDWKALGELQRGLEAFAPDLISIHSTKAGILARLAGKRLNIPTFFTVHGWAFTEGVSPRKRWMYRWVEKVAAPWATRLICVSDYDRRLALREGVGEASQLLTIHNGIPDSPLRADPSLEPPKIIMVARLDAPKDHAQLFQALSGLPEIHLDVVGDGPEEPKLRQLAETLGISTRVHFRGHTHHVDELLAQAQIFVLVSNYEAFPLSILEAMRAGLPVVASDVGGVGEAVVDEVTGYLIPRGDSTSLRDKLYQLLHDPALRSDMGRKGRQRFVEKFTSETMLTQTMALYHQVHAPTPIRPQDRL